MDQEEQVMNYRQLGELMFEMGYISGSKVSEQEERILLSTMWSSLGGDDAENLPKEVVRAFLIAVEGVKITDGVRTESPEEFGETKDGDFYPDCDKISKHFKLFYLNRIRYIGLRDQPRKEKIIEDMSKDMTFKPELSDATESYAQRYRQRIADAYDGKQVTVLDILTAETNKQQWIEETKKELEEEERKNCTFKPKTNNYRPHQHPDESRADESQTSYGLREGTGDKCFDLYQLSLLKQQQKADKTSEEVEFEKNKNELTFQPNLNKKKPKSSAKRHKVNQRSVMDTIERMRRAREEREYKRSMTERGYQPGVSKKAMKHGVDKKPLKEKAYNYTQKRATAPRPPEQSTLYQDIGHFKEVKGGDVMQEKPKPQPRPPAKVPKKRKPLYQPPAQPRRPAEERKRQAVRREIVEEEPLEMSPEQPSPEMPTPV